MVPQCRRVDAARQQPTGATATDHAQLSDVGTHGLGPTRARVLALLQDADEPLTATEVGERLGLHVNTARFHLDALAADGLVVRSREERTTPGRPKMSYSVAGQAPRVARRSYRLLAEMLTTMIAGTLPDPSTSSELTGRAWGRYLAQPTPPSQQPAESQALESLVDSLDRIGFDSRVVDDADSLRLEVSHCPFLELAVGNRQVVCSIHLGLIRGLLEQSGAPVAATSIEPLVEPSRCLAYLTRGVPQQP